ncbi:hypothetical protein PPERSA_00348 [Pseudocohnilembus persalinus]|uniref:RanBP2-type domain-containing protein n=1 Tax=Pseudocohnilembus persalinus TaxID=266149 RepID=A0A0V0QY36_PSEPJ|nr:hypothetical protein PPERSA_00348 [Pseudocohnilembus persalinus]|eukprot:KRX07191.1 hypothetical protein PPERSA_00348 [Pseudocohnilembus persalinus]
MRQTRSKQGQQLNIKNNNNQIQSKQQTTRATRASTKNQKSQQLQQHQQQDIPISKGKVITNQKVPMKDVQNKIRGIDQVQNYYTKRGRNVCTTPISKKALSLIEQTASFKKIDQEKELEQEEEQYFGKRKVQVKEEIQKIPKEIGYKPSKANKEINQKEQNNQFYQSQDYKVIKQTRTRTNQIQNQKNQIKETKKISIKSKQMTKKQLQQEKDLQKQQELQEEQKQFKNQQNLQQEDEDSCYEIHQELEEDIDETYCIQNEDEENQDSHILGQKNKKEEDEFNDEDQIQRKTENGKGAKNKYKNGKNVKNQQSEKQKDQSSLVQSQHPLDYSHLYNNWTNQDQKIEKKTPISFASNKQQQQKDLNEKNGTKGKKLIQQMEIQDKKNGENILENREFRQIEQQNKVQTIDLENQEIILDNEQIDLETQKIQEKIRKLQQELQPYMGKIDQQQGDDKNLVQKNQQFGKNINSNNNNLRQKTPIRGQNSVQNQNSRKSVTPNRGQATIKYDYQCINPGSRTPIYQNQATINNNKNGQIQNQNLVQNLAQIQNQILNGNQTANSKQCIVKEGDWICWNCSNFNYSYRNRCNRCQEEYNPAKSELVDPNISQNSIHMILKQQNEHKQLFYNQDRKVTPIRGNKTPTLQQQQQQMSVQNINRATTPIRTQQTRSTTPIRALQTRSTTPIRNQQVKSTTPIRTNISLQQQQQQQLMQQQQGLNITNNNLNNKKSVTPVRPGRSTTPVRYQQQQQIQKNSMQQQQQQQNLSVLQRSFGNQQVQQQMQQRSTTPLRQVQEMRPARVITPIRGNNGLVQQQQQQQQQIQNRRSTTPLRYQQQQKQQQSQNSFYQNKNQNQNDLAINLNQIYQETVVDFKVNNERANRSRNPLQLIQNQNQNLPKNLENFKNQPQKSQDFKMMNFNQNQGKNQFQNSNYNIQRKVQQDVNVVKDPRMQKFRY